VFSASLPITVNVLPDASGRIIGPRLVCRGQFTYSVPPIANATSYTWEFLYNPGVTISGTTNPVTVDFSGATSNYPITLTVFSLSWEPMLAEMNGICG